MENRGYKIVVTVPYAAGKSTLVRALCKDSISIDAQGTTVVMDYGRHKYQEMDISLFGTPGQSRFNFMIKNISENADGIIWVIDASFPETWPYALTIIREIIKAEKASCVIAPNKQDLKNARSQEVVYEKMDEMYPVVGTTAITGENVEKALNVPMERVGRE